MKCRYDHGKILTLLLHLFQKSHVTDFKVFKTLVIYEFEIFVMYFPHSTISFVKWQTAFVGFNESVYYLFFNNNKLCNATESYVTQSKRV